MIERLRSQWQQGLSFEAIVKLRDDLDAILQRIRSERHIRPPVFKCPKCGHVGEGAEPHVSVRAMILSVIRFGIADTETAYMIEKGWAAYRSSRGLIFAARAWQQSPPASPGASIHKPVIRLNSKWIPKPCGGYPC